MPFCDLVIRWVVWSDVGQQSDGVGDRILKPYYPVGFFKIGLHTQAHLSFKDRYKPKARNQISL